ncbi:hypothetical protein Alches_23140 [Alicyclobacillus hesperidum subsp. aegles]|uniref:hypothetical protein n=1 Tax=Alicyclobacillus hesperidum TaxID=89784 RepID=UPI00222AAA9A|nr:hypothetical protein [Alicyclobacillus hesperidum]GLG02273.1 hypothetical protein Alches_23140 [Alicyclobacillus hesperidum subsp. aegles]
MGVKKALVALAHTLLRIVYHILHRKKPYAELGPDYLSSFKQRNEERREAAMIRRLEEKGFQVSKP